MGVLRALFVDGPGWPWTPVWALAVGVGFGLQRAWRPAHKAKRDVLAVAILLAGLTLAGFAGHQLFRAFAPGGAGAQRVLILGGTFYALHAARLLLAFAAEEREGAPGLVGWLRANALQNGILVLLLVGYLAFRDGIAAVVPRFALVEFGLAVVVFGFVLQRLRSRLKREETELASASLARPHQRTATELREGEYDAVARPVALFIETGRGAQDYAAAVAGAALLPPGTREAVFAPLRAHREPPVLPPLPLRWALLATALTWTGLGVSAAVLAHELAGAPTWAAAAIAGAVLLAGAFTAQDALRARLRPWAALGLAAAATLGLFLDIHLVLFRGDLPSAAAYGLAGIGALMVGASAISSWRLHRALRRGEPLSAREPPGPALEKQAAAARRRVLVVLAGLIVLFLPVRFLAGWLARRGWAPDLVPVVLDDALGITVWTFAGFGAAAAIRYWGLTRHRPRVHAEEKARRAVRLDIHVTIMRDLERT